MWGHLGVEWACSVAYCAGPDDDAGGGTADDGLVTV